MNTPERNRGPLRPNNRIIAALYVTAVLLILVPFGDLSLGASPLRPVDVEWRYGAVGLASRTLLTPLLGLLIAVLTAIAAGHPRALVFLSAASALGALLLVVTSGGFLLDHIQMRNQVRPASIRVFDMAGMQALVKLVAVAVALMILALGGRGASHRRRWLAYASGIVAPSVVL